jgi:hypothetical protein
LDGDSLMNVESDYGLFELVVGFKKGSGDPSRVFRSMTGLIESVQSLDKNLSRSISLNVQTNIVLEEIESSSLKAKFRNIVEDIPDEALKPGDFRRLIGHFLVKSKHKVIDWCSEKDKITDKTEMIKLQNDILQLAENTDIKLIPAYSVPDTESLLLNMNSIRNALAILEPDDNAIFKSDEGISKFNKKMEISNEIIQEYITREKIISEGEKIFKVKRPDYLGYSMWDFKYQGKPIEAKILDEKWLGDFQKRKVRVLPGDSIRAIVKEEVSYGFNNDVIYIHYEIIQILEVLPLLIQEQNLLF